MRVPILSPPAGLTALKAPIIPSPVMPWDNGPSILDTRT
jgi:hypothetical protein